MKTIKKYEANDGTEFNSEAACMRHEALCTEIDEVMSSLPRRPKDNDCSFANGHGYIQHDAETFWAVRDALLRIGRRLSKHNWIDTALADRTVHPSWCARLFDDISSPLANAWSRILCTDNDLREWGQPFFAYNPDKVAPEDKVALNKPGKKHR